MKQLIAAVTATPVYNITEDTRVLVSPRSARARGDAGRVQGCESRGARIRRVFDVPTFAGDMSPRVTASTSRLSSRAIPTKLRSAVFSRVASTSVTLNASKTSVKCFIFLF